MKGADHIRQLIAMEAARLMYEEGVREYRDAKRKAARRFGPEKSLHLGSHLPSNAEIHEQLRHLISFFEGQAVPERLLRLRMLALQVMEQLEAFHPFLVGSVLAGTATERSDIDLHLFADSTEEVEDALRRLGIDFTSELVSIRRGVDFFEYPHIYLEADGTEVECTVYPLIDIYRVPKSSITGRAMSRADTKALKKLIRSSLRSGEFEGGNQACEEENSDSRHQSRPE